MAIHVEPRRFSGREGADGRSAEENLCYDFLDAVRVEYFRCDHAPADTIEDCKLVEEVLKAPICRNLFLTNRQQTEYYLLLLPGDKPFKTKYLSPQLGTARLSFAGEEALQEYLGVQPGSVSLLGLLNDRRGKVHLVIDRDLMKEEFFGCHPCRNTSTVSLHTEDVAAAVLPRLEHPVTWVDLPWNVE